VCFWWADRAGCTCVWYRWGGLGCHRFPVGFSGDVYPSWESLAFQPYFTLSAANVGFGYWVRTWVLVAYSRVQHPCYPARLLSCAPGGLDRVPASISQDRLAVQCFCVHRRCAALCVCMSARCAVLCFCFACVCWTAFAYHSPMTLEASCCQLMASCTPGGFSSESYRPCSAPMARVHQTTSSAPGFTTKTCVSSVTCVCCVCFGGRGRGAGRGAGSFALYPLGHCRNNSVVLKRPRRGCRCLRLLLAVAVDRCCCWSLLPLIAATADRCCCWPLLLLVVVVAGLA
jgi:hypothetical protein